MWDYPNYDDFYREPSEFIKYVKNTRGFSHERSKNNKSGDNNE